MEHISLCYDIIEYAKNMLDAEMNDYIYVTLTDHISYTIKLYKEGIFRPNVLIWEVKKFYSKEYNIGLKALDFIEDELGCRLPSDEAGNIALHLITAQVNNKYNKVEDIYDITKKNISQPNAELFSVLNKKSRRLFIKTSCITLKDCVYIIAAVAGVPPANIITVF